MKLIGWSILYLPLTLCLFCTNVVIISDRFLMQIHGAFFWTSKTGLGMSTVWAWLVWVILPTEAKSNMRPGNILIEAGPGQVRFHSKPGLVRNDTQLGIASPVPFRMIVCRSKWGFWWLPWWLPQLFLSDSDTLVILGDSGIGNGLGVLFNAFLSRNSYFAKSNNFGWIIQ